MDGRGQELTPRRRGVQSGDLCERCRGAHLDQDLCGVHVGAHAQLAGDLLADEQLVARHHLDADALLQAAGDGVLGVVAGGVEQGQQAHKHPAGVFLHAVA